MTCCGQKRQALVGAATGTRELAGPEAGRGAARGAAAHAAGPASVVPHTRGGRGGDVALRYRGVDGFSVRSPITGRYYACAAAGTRIHVDPRDAEMLARTGVFTGR
jgi:hypothetical protein